MTWTNRQMLAKWQPTALSLFRFITGLLLFQYGIAKIFKFPVLPYFAKVPPLITTAGALELVLGALLMIGLFTRIVAFILSGEMAFAYFLGHMFKNPQSRCSCRCSTAAPRRSCSASPVSIWRPPAAGRTASTRCGRSEASRQLRKPSFGAESRLRVAQWWASGFSAHALEFALTRAPE